LSFPRHSQLLLLGSLFFLFLLYFVFGTGWQEPAKLVLRGRAEAGAPLLKVRWDSGQGFNQYEQRTIQLLDSQNSSNITLGAIRRKENNACGPNILCTEVLVDGKEIDLRSISKEVQPQAGGLSLKAGESISFQVQAKSHIGFRFATSCLTAGTAFISVNGMKTDHDLFLAGEPTLSTQFDYWLLHPDGSFTVELDLPRYPLQTLEILRIGKKNNPVQLVSAKLNGKSKVIELLHDNQPVQLGSIRFSNVLNGMKTYVHPLQLVQQILFALLSAWLLTALVQRYRTIGSLRNCFVSEQRQWFWLMLAGVLLVFGFWLLAFWPGVLSIDSFKIWRAAKLPDVYSNEHPLLNIVLYKYFYHLWNNTAVIPVAQVVLTALFIAWFGFWIFKQGVPIKLVLLWLLFVLCSVPVGVYNVVLWKDIPFALLTVFWACLLVWLWQEKKQHQLHWTRQRSLALLLLGLALVLIRHNGLVYLAVLPVLLLLMRLVPLKKALVGLSVLLLVAGIGFVMLRNADETTQTGFFTKAVRWYANSVKRENIIQDVQRTAHDYLNVLDIEAPQADKFHYCMRGVAWWQLLRSGWWDVYPYHPSLNGEALFPKLRHVAMQIYEQSYAAPWLWLSWNPIWLLALLPLLTLCFRCLPNTAVLGIMLLSGTIPLVYLQIFNWRYYYFLYFGLLFLPAFVMLDIFSRKHALLNHNP